MPQAVIISQLTLIGVGLIGASLARVLKKTGYCRRVVGCGRSRGNLETALALGIIDDISDDPARAVEGADVVVLAVPLGAMATVLRRIAPHLDAATVVTDVGSAKGCVAVEARRILGTHIANFVPGHPIAGTEQSGAAASTDTLFQERCVILTPLEETAPAAVEQVRRLWCAAGARVSEMDVTHHDQILAATSHLPHLLAYALVDTLAGMDDSKEVLRYAAGGFFDFTRIASSDPVMWRDICLANREAILGMLGKFSGDIDQLAKLVDAADGERLQALFTRAKTVRDKLIRGVDAT